MAQLLIVGTGGFCGAVARYWLTGVAHRYLQGAFPYGTLVVNLLGCLAIGCVMGLVEFRQVFPPNVRVFLVPGILGGFTTFSAFGYETFSLLRDNEYLLAAANVAGNVVVGIVAVLVGWFAAKLLSA
jgi:CrcB protein